MSIFQKPIDKVRHWHYPSSGPPIDLTVDATDAVMLTARPDSTELAEWQSRHADKPSIPLDLTGLTDAQWRALGCPCEYRAFSRLVFALLIQQVNDAIRQLNNQTAYTAFEWFFSPHAQVFYNYLGLSRQHVIQSVHDIATGKRRIGLDCPDVPEIISPGTPDSREYLHRNPTLGESYGRTLRSKKRTSRRRLLDRNKAVAQAIRAATCGSEGYQAPILRWSKRRREESCKPNGPVIDAAGQPRNVGPVNPSDIQTACGQSHQATDAANPAGS